MKKSFSLILVMIAIAIPMIADDSKSNPSTRTIGFDLYDVATIPTVHRAPMRISVEAYYDALSQTITIQYDGEATGEVSLYRNGDLVDSSVEINTSFMVEESGYYTLEIITDSWSAIGSIDI